MIVEYLAPFRRDGSVGVESYASCKCDWCGSEWNCKVRTLKRYKNDLELGAICRECQVYGEPLTVSNALSLYPRIKRIIDFGSRESVIPASHIVAECDGCHRDFETRFRAVFENNGKPKCGTCRSRHTDSEIKYPHDFPEIEFDTNTLGGAGQIKERSYVKFNCPQCGAPGRSMWAHYKDGSRLCLLCSSKVGVTPEGAKRIGAANRAHWESPEYRDRQATSRAASTYNYSNTMSGPHRKLKEMMNSAGLTSFVSEKWVGKGVRADEVDFDKKIIVELNGDYFHANPSRFAPGDVLSLDKSGKTAQDIWDKEAERISKINSWGYRVVVIWESELKELGYRVLDRIRDAVA